MLASPEEQGSPPCLRTPCSQGAARTTPSPFMSLLGLPEEHSLRLTDSWSGEEEMHEFPNIEMKNGASGEAARIIGASIKALVA